MQGHGWADLIHLHFPDLTYKGVPKNQNSNCAPFAFQCEQKSDLVSRRANSITYWVISALV